MHFEKKGWIFVVNDISEFEQQRKEGRVFDLGQGSQIGVFIAYATLPRFSPNFDEKKKALWIQSRDYLLKKALRDLGASSLEGQKEKEIWQSFQGGLDQMK
jgi:hypothetical protein